MRFHLRRAAILLVVTATGILCACNDHKRPGSLDNPKAGKLIITGVTVVDVGRGALLPDMTMLMDAGKIISIVPDGSGLVQSDARTVDAHGKYVVPGFLDMHAHPLGPDDPSAALTLMLVKGITGFRQMQGSPELLGQRRQGTLPISRDAPALLAMPGTILTPFNASNPKEAVATVDEQKQAGADFIKVIAVSPAAFFAAQSEAKRVGLPFVGHLPDGVDVILASKGGIKSIEHLGTGNSVLATCSTDEVELKREIAKLPITEGPPFKIPFLEQIMSSKIRKRLINPLVEADSAEITLLRRAVDTYSEAKCRALAATLVTDGTWLVPTLIRLRTMEFGDAPVYLNDPNLRYLPTATVQSWQDVSKAFTKDLSPFTKSTYRDVYALQLRLVNLFSAAGVPMMAGSDLGGGWLVPGFSLHQEFDELEKAGLSPLTVLKMATINGAAFLGRTGSMGSTEPGKNADLVLLDANPLTSVQNLHKIFAVVRDGFYYSSEELQGLARNVQAHANDGH